MSCILLISSCKFLNIYICLLSIVLFDISLAHLIMTYFFLSVLHYSSMLTMMLIGLVAQILLLSVSVCFLVMWLSLRNVKKKNMTLSPSHLLRLNIMPCLLPTSRSFGFVVFSHSLVFSRFNLHYCMLTTPVSSKLVSILSTMNAQST
jgi:hypothetical protein